MSGHMRRMAALAGGAFFLAGLAAFGGCNDDPPHFGPAGGLAGRSPDDQAPPEADSGSSGTTDGGGSSGTSGCTPPPADAGAACPSFATDIYGKLMAATGSTYKCAQAGCHATGGTVPLLPDAPTAYTTLKAYTIQVGAKKVPYINPGCIEPAQGSFTCNLQASGFCGQGRMPTTGQVTTADLATIAQWIACGSPP